MQNQIELISFVVLIEHNTLLWKVGVLGNTCNFQQNFGLVVTINEKLFFFHKLDKSRNLWLSPVF